MNVCPFHDYLISHWPADSFFHISTTPAKSSLISGNIRVPGILYLVKSTVKLGRNVWLKVAFLFLFKPSVICCWPKRLMQWKKENSESKSIFFPDIFIWIAMRMYHLRNAASLVFRYWYQRSLRVQFRYLAPVCI